jgi:hypothetical protein
VPPFNVIEVLSPEKINAGIIVCKTSDVEPAVPISKK